MTCEHCSHPMYAGIRCGVCGKWSDALHTCSYECERPECIKAQRDGLRKDLQNALRHLEWAMTRDEPLLRQALEALEACLGWPHVIAALRERLGEKT